MKLTDKKLKVNANLNMAYVINYLNKYCGFARADAFCVFTASDTFAQLMNLKTGLCSALAPEILFMLCEEKGLSISDDDDKISGAFDIGDDLSYTVNMCGAVREKLGLPPLKFAQYAQNHRIWEFIEKNYEELSPLKREKCVNYIIKTVD